MRFNIFIIYFLLLCFSCSGDDLFEKELLNQNSILKALQENVDIINIKQNAESYTVYFSNEITVPLSRRFTPYITKGENGNWFINERDTGVSSVDNYTDCNSIPAFSIQNGFYYINNLKTGIEAAVIKDSEDKLYIIGIYKSIDFYCFYLSDNSIFKANILQELKDGISIDSKTFVSDESLSIPVFPYCNKFGNDFHFYADVSSFGKLMVCQGYMKYRGYWFEIDSVNISLLSYNHSVITHRTVPHGLDISSFITINISINKDCHALVRMTTSSGYFEHSFEEWSEAANGLIEVRNKQCILSNVVFSINNRYFDCPFWIFGASQEGINNARWVGQIKKMGYLNCLVNALAGRNSSGIIEDLRRALKFGRPKYVYFGLSNDGYNYKTYKGRMDEAKALADKYGFEIIFVAKFRHPLDGNDGTYLKKRNTVITYGCRYFDYGMAVSSDPTDPNAVFEGYMDSLYVHPAGKIGAIALAKRFLVDVPEIMQY